MSEKDEVIRKRLLELEKKHARAVRKLQIAERRRQRRQTFHGFSVQDENTDSLSAQNTSSALPYHETLNSPDIKKPSCLSTHKKNFGKNVTFRETFDEALCSDVKWNRNGNSYDNETALRGSLKSQIKSNCSCEKSEFDGESDIKSMYIDAPKTKSLSLTSDSLVLSDDKKSDGVAVTGIEVNPSEMQELEVQVVKDDLADHLSNLSNCVEGSGDSTHDACSLRCDAEIECSAKVVNDQSNDTFHEKGTATNQNSHDIASKNLNLLTGSFNMNGKDGLQKIEPNNNFSTLTENYKDCSPMGNCHWLKLFEEEFPRRSPRLQTTPNFRCQDDTSYVGHVVQARKTKESRSQKSRAKKEGYQNKTTETTTTTTTTPKTKDISVQLGLAKGNISDDFIFPRPCLELTKSGGPLGIEVDFSLPDKEFVKLKLAKVKNALLAERESSNVSYTKGVAQTPVNKLGENSKPQDGKSATEEKSNEVYESMEHYKTVEMVENLEASVSQGGFVVLDDEIKLREIEIKSSASKVEKGKSEIVKEESTTVFLQSNEQSGCYSSSVDYHRLQDMTPEDTCVKASSSPKQISHEGDSSHTCMPCSCIKNPLQMGGFEKANRISTGENDKLKEFSHKARTDINESLKDKISQQKTETSENGSGREFSNQGESPDQASKTRTGANENCRLLNVLFDSAAQTIPRNLCEEEFHNSFQGVSSPPPTREPCIGDQATPHGKMCEPLESSQRSHSCMVLAEDSTQHHDAPVSMTICLQHCINGEDNKVRSLSLSSYEPSPRKATSSLTQNKRDVLAVCLAHLVVIWTLTPGLQWTVMHKWNLSLGGEEEFVSVQFVPLKSHVVLLVGGNFSTGTGRILGYSEEGDYSLDLINADEGKKPLFSSMCLLQRNLEPRHSVNELEDVELMIGGTASDKVTLTKWSLDGSCLLVEGSQTFGPLHSDTGLSSLQAVQGSHCLLLGITDVNLYLWNHKSFQLLRSFNLETLGLGGMFCLKVIAQRGLLFLMMASNSDQKHDFVNTNADACSLYALNPKNSKVVCLERFCLSERVSVVGTNGQYIAAGIQGRGKVSMWNIRDSGRNATLNVFQDDQVSCIGYHKDMTLVAFGSINGCVHVFSLC